MTNYKQAGVDINEGEKSSLIAYSYAKETFKTRNNLIGKPIIQEGGFTGALDFGDYYLIQNTDGVGSKIEIADAIKDYSTIGYDLLAMVADDAICVGAETISITNTIDTEKVDSKVVEEMMKGLKKACIEQKVVIPGGEIAELPGLVKGNLWNATALGIVEKTKFITGKNVKPGDKILGLKSKGFRSNGFTLVRHILKKQFGKDWYNKKYCTRGTWGKVVLTPSQIYSNAILDIIGRYKKTKKAEIKSIIHITGGGIPGNIKRGLNGYGASLTNLPKPQKMMHLLQKMGKVTDEEAYKVWNMGIGMILISNEEEKIKKILEKHNIKVSQIGVVTKDKKIEIISQGVYKKGKNLIF